MPRKRAPRRSGRRGICGWGCEAAAVLGAGIGLHEAVDRTSSGKQSAQPPFPYNVAPAKAGAQIECRLAVGQPGRNQRWKTGLCCSQIRDLRMGSSLLSGAVLATFNWSENRRAGHLQDRRPAHPAPHAPWRVISARRADKLLREKLSERVFAVRVRAFNRSYGGAELNMHLSLSQDMTPLADFLKTMKDKGLHGVTAGVERGTI